MGNYSTKSDSSSEQSATNENVNFDSFKILRSIGKGSFGKVCMVQKQSNERLFAMKYLNKEACVKNDFVENVKQEISILQKLKHENIVNLWYTFQDEEDFFIVVDLLLGGDLRFHMSKHVQFSENDIRVYLLEMASVLEYLRSKSIIHRDIKPDNILLDEKGHAFLTDFNIAIHLDSASTLATSFAGTKPYVAPEIYHTKNGTCEGYSYSADWWSLGVTVYELLRHKRPFPITGDATVEEVIKIFDDGKVSFSSHWSQSLINLFLDLFMIDETRRMNSYERLRALDFCSDTAMVPHFVPSKKHLNYDPTYELEEMMIESKPLHKKKQRIKKRSKRSKTSSLSEVPEVTVNSCQKLADKHSELFVTFNRELMESNKKEPP